MEIILKKYFWVVNLVVVAVCAGFAGRAADHFVEGAYLAGDDIQALHHGAPPALPKVHGKDGEVILSRDIFCSGCAPAKAAEDDQGAAEESHEWQKSSLQLELVSTMVCPSDDRWSMAVIRDLSTEQKDPLMYNQGATVGTTGAQVVKVTAQRVYLKNGTRNEYLELDGKAPVAAAAPVSRISVAAPPINTALGDIDHGVTCSGNACTVDRSLVEKLLSNTTMLATSARFVPSVKDGRPDGFKLYAIRPNSIFGKIGLQNGDTIKAINGSEMTTPDAALALYTKLRNASHLSVQVERRGQTVTLDYSIR